MPTLHTSQGGPYRFHFYSSDRDEPPHAHVEREDKTAKFWLNPVKLHKNAGFSEIELRKIQRIIKKHQTAFYAQWIKFFAK